MITVADGWSIGPKLVGIIPTIKLQDEHGNSRLVSPVSDPWLYAFLDALYKENEE